MIRLYKYAAAVMEAEVLYVVAIILIVFVTVMMWRRKEEDYRKRGQSKYALLADFNQVRQLGNLIPRYKFRLRR